MTGVKDEEIIRAAQKAIDEQEEVTLDYAIKNTDRAVGTMLSGVIAKKYGEAGLPDGTIKIKFKGSAGQSFGAFAVKGLDIRLEGETNDYFGKGCPQPVAATTSRPRRTSSQVTPDYTEPLLANSSSMVRWVNASACVTQVPLPSSRAQAIIVVSI